MIEACQDGIWAELAGHGPRRDYLATWTEPVVRIDIPDIPRFVAAGGTHLVGDVCDQLLGPGRWIRHPGIGGTVPVRFPSLADPGDAGGTSKPATPTTTARGSTFAPVAGACSRSTCSPTSGLDDAPTRIRPGSHLDVPPILRPAGQPDPDGGLDWPTAAQQAVRASAHRPTVWATGQAGLTFSCATRSWSTPPPGRTVAAHPG